MKVGFVGLGTMGLAMAANILRGGHEVRGYDRSAAAVDAHAGNGGIPAASVAEACDGAEMVITMLPDGKATRKALFEDDALSGLKSDALVIDMEKEAMKLVQALDRAPAAGAGAAASGAAPVVAATAPAVSPTGT